MLPQLPIFNEGTSGARFGSFWNQIRRRIYRQSMLSSATIKVSDTDRGQQLDRVGGGGTSSALSLGFCVEHTGASVTVAAGKVLSQSWSGTTAADFKPADWTLETNFTGATLSSAATEVWLQVQFTETDLASEGGLGTTSIDMSGSAGGAGGGGAGGGASGGDTATTDPGNDAAPGDGGAFGGARGQGASVFDEGTTDPLIGTGEGSGGSGGDGGDGGAGGNGTSQNFTRPINAVVQVRYYTLSSISAHTSKGSSSQLATWVQLATITGTNVAQHHIGTLRLHPATITFVAP